MCGSVVQWPAAGGMDRDMLTVDFDRIAVDHGSHSCEGLHSQRGQAEKRSRKQEQGAPVFTLPIASVHPALRRRMSRRAPLRESASQ